MIEDQAQSLRDLMGANKQSQCHTIAVTSGKGGVGKTNISLNLAVLAAQMGFRAMVLDADLGLANVHVVANVRPKYNLSHVIAGKKSIEEVIIPGPSGISIVPGASGIAELADLPEARRMKLVEQLHKLETQSDILFIDTSAGISRNVINFAAAADKVLVVTTPDPAAITDAYAIIKTIAHEEFYGEMGLVINMAENKIAANRTASGILSVCEQFLGVYVESLGYIVSDSHVPLAVRKRIPVVELFPRTHATFCMKELIHKILPKRAEPEKPGFFKRFLNVLSRTPR